MRPWQSTHRWTLAFLLALACAGCGSEPSAAPSVADDAASEATIARGRIPFLHRFDRGSELARASGKPMLIFFTAEWCDYCQALAQDAFCQEAVVNASEQFVCVLVDADQERALCQRFQVRSYPTIQFVSPDGVALNRLIGQKPGQELVMEMQAILQSVARRPDDVGGYRLR